MKRALYVTERANSPFLQYTRQVSEAFRGTTDPETGKAFSVQIRMSLKTADIAEANRKAALLTVKYDSLFHPLIIDLSDPEYLEAVRKQLYAKVLQDDDERRIRFETLPDDNIGTDRRHPVLNSTLL